MNSRKRSGSGIFLMEMIMVCGFFLLCAAICIQVFMRSDAMSRLAREKNQAILAAESLAETWKAKGIEGLSAAEGKTLADGELSYMISFDENWMVLEKISRDGSPDEAFYVAELTQGEEAAGQEKVEYLNLVIRRGTTHPYWRERDKDGQFLTLYSLQVKKYREQGGGGHGQE